MNYKVHYDNENESVLERLLKIRKIDDNLEDFLSPTFSRYRNDPRVLNDFEK